MKFSLLCLFFLLALVAVVHATTTFNVKVLPGKAFPNQVAFKAALDSCTTDKPTTGPCTINKVVTEKYQFPAIPNIFGTTFTPYLTGNDIIAQLTFPEDNLAFEDYALCYLTRACNGAFDFAGNLVSVKQPKNAEDLLCFDKTTCGASIFCLCGPGVSCTSDEQCSTDKCTLLDGAKSCEADHVVAYEITLSPTKGANLADAQADLAFILSNPTLQGQLLGWMNYCTALVGSPRSDADLTTAVAHFWIQPNALNADKCDPKIVNGAFSKVTDLKGAITASAAVIPFDTYPSKCLIPGGGFYCSVISGCDYMSCQASDFTNGSGQCETTTQCTDGYSCDQGLCSSAFGYSLSFIVVTILATLFF